MNAVKFSNAAICLFKAVNLLTDRLLPHETLLTQVSFLAMTDTAKANYSTSC